MKTLTTLQACPEGLNLGRAILRSLSDGPISGLSSPYPNINPIIQGASLRGFALRDRKIIQAEGGGLAAVIIPGPSRKENLQQSQASEFRKGGPPEW